MEVRISDLYKPLYTSKKRYFLITGGRGSLKSTTVHDFIARLTYERGHGILILRYTMTSAEKSVIPEFKHTLEKLNIEKDFDISGTTIKNVHTGSFILFSGIKTSSGNQTANLKSLAGITTVIIEEGEDFTDEQAFDKIDDSVRAVNVQNRIIWILNPTTREHFIYKRWIEKSNKIVQRAGYNVPVSDHPQVEAIHTTYHIAEKFGYLNQSFVDKANEHRVNAEMSDDPYRSHYYYNYIGGWKEKLEGTIFKYDIGQFDHSLTYLYGQDFGFHPDPVTLVRVAVDNSRKIIYLQEEAYNNNKLRTSEVFHLNKSRLINPYDLIIADSAEPRLISELQDLGLNIEMAYKPAGSVLYGINKMLEYKIVVTNDSYNLRVEMDHYVWNDRKSGIPIDKYNHLIDAARYAFMRLTENMYVNNVAYIENLY
jgi:phage terminase large subunit